MVTLTGNKNTGRKLKAKHDRRQWNTSVNIHKQDFLSSHNECLCPCDWCMLGKHFSFLVQVIMSTRKSSFNKINELMKWILSRWLDDFVSENKLLVAAAADVLCNPCLFVCLFVYSRKEHCFSFESKQQLWCVKTCKDLKESFVEAALSWTWWRDEGGMMEVCRDGWKKVLLAL